VRIGCSGLLLLRWVGHVELWWRMGRVGWCIWIVRVLLVLLLSNRGCVIGLLLTLRGSAILVWRRVAVGCACRWGARVLILPRLLPRLLLLINDRRGVSLAPASGVLARIHPQIAQKRALAVT
jgi:hypothetical protein